MKRGNCMRRMKKNWQLGMLLGLMLIWAMSLPVFAASDDNSLAALGVENGTVSQEFSYDKWEYDVTVEPGVSELQLSPKTSNPNAQITSIRGTQLEDGTATVLINTVSESGIAMTYTLHVTTAEGAAGEAETETQAETQATEQTETILQTEAMLQTEMQTEVATNILQGQINKLKSNSDLMVKILYGLIAFSVILLFIVIHMILKNRDLKDDLKDAEDKLAYQTNEFARKEKFLATDNYYAPTQQGRMKPSQPAPEAEASVPVVEETFGTRVAAGGYQGMQPEDVPMASPGVPPVSAAGNTPAAAAQPEPLSSTVSSQPTVEETILLSETGVDRTEVDITMIEL